MNRKVEIEFRILVLVVKLRPNEKVLYMTVFWESEEENVSENTCLPTCQNVNLKKC